MLAPSVFHLPSALGSMQQLFVGRRSSENATAVEGKDFGRLMVMSHLAFIFRCWDATCLPHIVDERSASAMLHKMFYPVRCNKNIFSLKYSGGDTHVTVSKYGGRESEREGEIGWEVAYREYKRSDVKSILEKMDSNCQCVGFWMWRDMAYSINF